MPYFDIQDWLKIIQGCKGAIHFTGLQMDDTLFPETYNDLIL